MTSIALLVNFKYLTMKFKNSKEIQTGTNKSGFYLVQINFTSNLEPQRPISLEIRDVFLVVVEFLSHINRPIKKLNQQVSQIYQTIQGEKQDSYWNLGASRFVKANFQSSIFFNSLYIIMKHTINIKLIENKTQALGSEKKARVSTAIKKIKDIEDLVVNERVTNGKMNEIQRIQIKQYDGCTNSKLGCEQNEEKGKSKSKVWKKDEIQHIFNLYFQFGSHWKIMQTQFPSKSANSIKNRFYTVIRTVLKHLFKWHPNIILKLPHQIASKQILKFYEARDQYSKFKGFGRKILKRIDFDAESPKLKTFLAENSSEILQLHNLIYKSCSSEKSRINKAKNQIIKSNSQKIVSEMSACSAKTKQMFLTTEGAINQIFFQNPQKNYNISQEPLPILINNFQNIVFFLPYLIEGYSPNQGSSIPSFYCYQ